MFWLSMYWIRLDGEITVTDLEKEEILPLNLKSLQLRDMYVKEKKFLS